MTERHIPTVGRIRFDERGELVEESVYATEGELNGFGGEQLKLGIGAGERPLSELPMFGQADLCAACWEEMDGVEEMAGPDGLCDQCRSKGAKK